MATEHEKFKLSQRWTSEDYTEMFTGLLPRGFIWRLDRIISSRIIQDVIEGIEWQDDYTSAQEIQDVIESSIDDGNLLKRLLSCLASEYALVEASAWGVINSTDPGVAVDVLEDWERNLGLPESCLVEFSLSLTERQRIASAKLFDSGKTLTLQWYIDYAASLGFVVTVQEIPFETAPRIMGVAIMGLEVMGGYGGNSIIEITIVSGSSDNDILKCAITKLKPAHVIISWVE
jgi:uncharacterized protein YmfQ (DUF2313 family)